MVDRATIVGVVVASAVVTGAGVLRSAIVFPVLCSMLLWWILLLDFRGFGLTFSANKMKKFAALVKTGPGFQR